MFKLHLIYEYFKVLKCAKNFNNLSHRFSSKYKPIIQFNLVLAVRKSDMTDFEIDGSKGLVKADLNTSVLKLNVNGF